MECIQYGPDNTLYGHRVKSEIAARVRLQSQR